MGEAKVATPCIEGIAATIGQGEPGQNVMTLRELPKYGLIDDEGKTTQWIRCTGMKPKVAEGTMLTDFIEQVFYLSERDKIEMHAGPLRGGPKINGIYKSIVNYGQYTAAGNTQPPIKGEYFHVPNQTPDEIVRGLRSIQCHRDPFKQTTLYPNMYTYICDGVGTDVLRKCLRTNGRPCLGGGNGWNIEIQVPCSKEEAISSIPANTCGTCGQKLSTPVQLQYIYDQERRELSEGVTTWPWGPYSAEPVQWKQYLENILFHHVASSERRRMLDEYTTPKDQLYFRWVRINLDE